VRRARENGQVTSTPAGTAAHHHRPRADRHADQLCTVQADRQRQLVDLLVRATDDVLQHLPGVIAANIYASTDGTRVVNYAQWQSADAFHAMLDNPSAQVHMRQAAAIADPTPTFTPWNQCTIADHVRLEARERANSP
jgi:hypothetical protein